MDALLFVIIVIVKVDREKKRDKGHSGWDFYTYVSVTLSKSEKNIVGERKK